MAHQFGASECAVIQRYAMLRDDEHLSIRRLWLFAISISILLVRRCTPVCGRNSALHF